MCRVNLLLLQLNLKNQFKHFILFTRDDQNDELIAVITTFPISHPYIPPSNEESEKNSKF